jgi:hypothetical protein
MKITEMIEINGKVYPHTRDMTPEEEQEFNTSVEILPYEQRVVNRIREVYSVDDELAILRQRDTKPEEFEQYNAFVEKIKAEEREV